jgi:hypothetical protein
MSTTEQPTDASRTTAVSPNVILYHAPHRQILVLPWLLTSGVLVLQVFLQPALGLTLWTSPVHSYPPL